MSAASGYRWSRRTRARSPGCVTVALPLRRDNSALVGFLVFAAPRLPPRHVELALLESLDELGLALARKPALDGAEHAEPLETVPHPGDFALVRLDQR